MGDDGFGDDWGDDPKSIPLNPPGAPPGTTISNNPQPPSGQFNQPPAYESSAPSAKGGGDKVEFHLIGQKREQTGRKNWRENVFGKPWKTPDP